MTEADERPLRVIAADDHAIVRAGIGAVLAVEPDMRLVAAVATAAEAIAAVAEHGPDVVVMDLQLPDLDGAAATRRLLADRPGTAVLMLTMHEDDESVINAVRAGARGYLVKGAGNADIAAAIRAVARGEAVFGAQVAQRLLDSVAGRSPVPLPELTDRERDVLRLLAAGHGTNEVARRLFLSPKTIRNNVCSIVGKLGVADRAHAIVLARAAGLPDA